jgi:hypothetical protein
MNFRDPEKFIDASGNTAEEKKIQGTLQKSIYFDPASETAVNGGGESMKYSFLTVVSLNILLKVVLQSSMSAMWSAVHTLQVFHLLLYMDFNFPNNLLKFGEYLAVAEGDLEEIS